MPSAHDDPFGAMNAMAAQATVQRAPEMVIVHDGTPVEHVGQTSFGSTLLRIAIPAAIALVIGLAIGKIGESASDYNAGLKGARAILGDKSAQSTVIYLKKVLADLDTVLDDARGKGFKPSPDLDKQLKDILAKLDVKAELVFRAKQNTLDPETVGQILSFYAGIAEVKDMLDQHAKSALADDMSLKKGKAAADQATADTPNGAPFKYGVFIDAPSDQDKGVPFGAKIVLLTGAYCGTSTSPQPKCADGEQASAYAYENDAGAVPTKGDYTWNGADTIPSKKVIPLLQNGIRDALVNGAEPTVAEIYYARRLREIYERIHGKQSPDGKSTGGLLDDGNKLETRLETEAKRSSRFSFFM